MFPDLPIRVTPDLRIIKRRGTGALTTDQALQVADALSVAAFRRRVAERSEKKSASRAKRLGLKAG